MRINEKMALKAAQKLVKEKDHMEVTGRGLDSILPQMSTKQKRTALKSLIRMGMTEEEARKTLRFPKKKETD